MRIRINSIDRPAAGRAEIYVVLLFFCLYLAVGLVAYRDYGVSWDEPLSRYRGILTLKYVLNGDKELLNADWKYHHGSVFETALVAVEGVLGNTNDIRSVYLSRHLTTFLLFYSSVFMFFLLIKRSFESWQLGLLGCLFLAASPRIFAHSFFNPKDIPFLALFIVALYTMVCFLDRKTFLRAAGHGIACGLLMDVRAIGVMIPALTVLFLILECLRSAQGPRVRLWALLSAAALLTAAVLAPEGSVKVILGGIARLPALLSNGLFLLVIAAAPLLVAWKAGLRAGRIIRSGAVYGMSTAGATAIFWPVLWTNPVGEFARALLQTNTFPWPYTVLYMGRYYPSGKLPWHYIPVWMLISTPILYSALFILGLSVIGVRTFKQPTWCIKEGRNDLIFAICVLVPVAAAMGMKAVIYDDWRQFYFVYPAFLLVGLRGLAVLVKFAGVRINSWIVIILHRAVPALICVATIITIVTMIQMHPLQNVYFNRLAGRGMDNIKQNFDADYWGLSYRKALEFIVGVNTGKNIRIYAANYPAKANVNLLDASDRMRISFTEGLEGADYYVGNYRWHREEYDFGNEVYSVKVGNAKIAAVIKLGEYERKAGKDHSGKMIVFDTGKADERSK